MTEPARLSRPNPRPYRLNMAALALIPAWIIVVAAYIGTMVWTIVISFTGSKLLPVYNFVGFDQYVRLFASDRWQVSVWHLAVFGVLFIVCCLIVGFLLAVALDQKIRFENTFRTIFLYPYAMSFIVTGLIWQWLMNPNLGIQNTVRNWGWTSFTFDWAVNSNLAVFALVIAAIWQASGLVMALMLAGLRGVDTELWKAAKIDRIPTWRVYVSIIIPILTPTITTATVLLSIAVIKVYDLVVALTNGGPGTASEMPAKFVMDNLGQRQNIGLATAASTMMLITVICVVSPWLYHTYFRRQSRRPT
ncbi:sugar ABC transporter permease [Labrys sp. LIt4]|uniref:Sugar ABC transporter permease n=1 Tax=Labrys okinawensis TaxID=346911 RepID=A0A2S9Q768_9HYPH|nr:MULTISPECIES: sugar ABC transporter permease [Labrys]MBP0577717.1 sugar ABC transporter permease [Labrys sp. LIt4]PRH85191.1 sugar ABC transporter permease [Labrys okinawensis]